MESYFSNHRVVTFYNNPSEIWVFLLMVPLYFIAAAAKLLQSCPTLCDPRDGSPPGSPVPGILQARTLEWGASSFSSAWQWKVKVRSLSCVRLYATPWTAAYQAPPPMGFSRWEYWSGVPLPSPLYFISLDQIRMGKNMEKSLKKTGILVSAVPVCSVAQSWPTPCDSIDCSSPGSSVHGILQVRTLEWVAISCSRASSNPKTVTTKLCKLSLLSYKICLHPRLKSEKAMAPHSSTLAWKIPWMEEPGRLQSTGLLRVGHDWATSLSLFTFLHWRRTWQPTPVFLPGESQGQGSLVGCRLWGRTSWTRLMWLSSHPRLK